MANIDDLLQQIVLDALGEAADQALGPLYAFALSDICFTRMFRLTKPLARQFIGMLWPYMTEATRASAINCEMKVLVALRFFATGSYQLDIGSNLHFQVCQPTVSRILHEVIEAANRPEIFNEMVSFPRSFDELRILRQKFYDEHAFPGVFGCIDGTFVAIFPPHIEDEEYPEYIYVCRKGYHAINVQLVCDWRMKILNVNARFPGSTNDVYIFNNSNVSTYMIRFHDEFGQYGFSLLGDSGYSLRTYMLTPIDDAVPGSPEALYNEYQMRARALIERCNGLLKIRFRCLSKHRVLNYDPETASKIINTCVILHNLCVENNVPEPAPDQDDDEPAPEEDGDEPNFEDLENPIELEGNNGNANNLPLLKGRAYRQRIVQRYFT